MAIILSFEFDNNIKIIEALKKGETLSVLRYMSIDTVCVKDGNIIDMDGIVNLINEELKSNGIKTKRAIFVINSSKIMIRKIKLPLLKKSSEILSMIKIELQQTVSADLSKYKIIYEISNITNENKIPYAEYIVYCVPEILVNRYIELAAKLKLKLLNIDIFPNCINALYKNNIKINDVVLNNKCTAAFINASKNSISFSAVNNGFCDFYIRFECTEAFIEKAAAPYYQYGYSESITVENTFTSQIAKFMRYYFSVSGSRSIDKIYIYGSSNKKLKEAIKAKLNMNTEIISSISCLTANELLNNFDLDKYFNTVLASFSRNNFLNINAVNKKIKNNYGYAAILLIIAAAITVLLGFFNSQAATRNELIAMSSYINDEENNEIDSVIEEIKKETDYLELYLQQAEMLQKAVEDNDNVDTSIFREINRVKPFGTKVTSIYSDKDSTQLQCVSPSMSEAALFFSDIKKIELIDSAYIPAIQSKSRQPFSYSIILKLKGVGYNE